MCNEVFFGHKYFRLTVNLFLKKEDSYICTYSKGTKKASSKKYPKTRIEYCGLSMTAHHKHIHETIMNIIWVMGTYSLGNSEAGKYRHRTKCTKNILRH